MKLEKLICTSNIIYLLIENYIPERFEFQDWLIYDKYIAPKSNLIVYGSYNLIVETKEEVGCDDLDEVSLKTNKLISAINELFRYTPFLSFNDSKNHINSFSKRLIFPCDMPIGWNSNYWELKKSAKKPGQFSIDWEIETVKNRVTPNAPIKELEIMLNGYATLPSHIKGLIDLHNSANMIDNHICYLVLGKALEIIDSIYPYKKPDNRIADSFPELVCLFKGITIKRLMDWANNRRETRHYIGDKDTCSSHQSLSDDEAEIYYVLINELVIYEVRRNFKLDVYIATMMYSNDSYPL